jgi:hypothetical protein
MAFVFSFSASAQLTPESCGNTNCTSNDVHIVRAYISGKDNTAINCSDADPFKYAELHLVLYSKTGRIGASISGNLVADNVSHPIGQCFTGETLNTGSNNNLWIPVGTLLAGATCTTDFELKNLFISWGTGNTDFCSLTNSNNTRTEATDPNCPETPAKCRFVDGEVIHVDIKLNVDFNWVPGTCEAGTSNIVNFTSLLDLGSDIDPSSIKYAWDFNNDGTPDSDLESPQYTFAGPGTYPVTLTVTAKDINGGDVTPAPRELDVVIQSCCNLATPSLDNVNFCVTSGQTKTVADLIATFPALSDGEYLVYATIDGETPLANSAELTSTTYYVSILNAPCESGRDQVDVIVKATPTVNQPGNQVVCNGANTVKVEFSGTNATSYTWTNDTQGIGLGASGTGDIALFQATNNTDAPVIATITVTPHNGDCVGTSKTFTITVNPTATITTTLNNITKCNGVSATVPNFTSNVSSATYAWTSTADVGFGVSGNGNIGNFTATNNGTSTVTATVIVTPSANNCTGTAKSFTVTVYPTATVNSISNASYCNGQTASPINFSGPVSSTTFTWVSTADIGFGTSSNGNSTGIPAFTALNKSGNPSVTATITVTPSANGCPGTPFSFDITVSFCGEHIFPTQTTCANYKDFIANPKGPNPAVELQSICVTTSTSKKGTVVFNATPGVFFYYATVTVPAGQKLTYEVDQVGTCSFGKFALVQDQIIAWNSSCVKAATGSESKTSPGFAIITIDNSKSNAAQTYVISVKYDTKSINGGSVANKQDCYYTFFTKQGNTVLNSTVGSIKMTQNCKSSAVTARDVQTQTAFAQVYELRATPNPTHSYFTVQLPNAINSAVNVRVMDVLGRVVEAKQNLAAGQTLRIGSGYKPGVYIVEVTQAGIVKQLKLVKQ